MILRYLINFEPLKKYKCIKMALIFKHLMQKFC